MLKLQSLQHSIFAYGRFALYTVPVWSIFMSSLFNNDKYQLLFGTFLINFFAP